MTTSAPEIRFANDISLPTEAVTQTLALLGKRGGGKTYAALLLAEGMLEAKAQIVAIDGVGKWWSLRLGADGTSPGFEIPVFGGHHGDLPLTPDAGALIASLVVGEGVSGVLDVSLLRKGERKRFVTDFAEQLYHLKKLQTEPSPLHLFLEESQMFVPQKVMRDEARMLGAFEDLVKLGRNVGIGCTLISQRPQAVNKDVLTQTECLIVLQTIGAQERKALREWTREVGEDRSDAVDQLPQLRVGEAFIWSPAWLRTFVRTRIGRRRTFDASATPRLGTEKLNAARRPARLELDELKSMMAEVVQRAEGNDPGSLRERIAKLEAALQRAEATQKAQAPTDEIIEAARLQGEQDAWSQITQALTALRGEALGLAERLHAITDGRSCRRPGQTASGPAPVSASPSRPLAAPRASGDVRLRKGAVRMLGVLAQRAPVRLTTAQWATLSKLKRTGGTWQTYVSDLRRAGYVEQRGDLWAATEVGVAAAGTLPPAPQSTIELVSMWKANLRAGERRMLDALVEQYPNALPRDELAQRCGIAPSGGTFSTYLSVLRSNGLAEVERGEVRAGETLFPYSAARGDLNQVAGSILADGS